MLTYYEVIMLLMKCSSLLHYYYRLWHIRRPIVCHSSPFEEYIFTNSCLCDDIEYLLKDRVGFLTSAIACATTVVDAGSHRSSDGKDEATIDADEVFRLRDRVSVHIHTLPYLPSH
jgi:hypothetical protein